MALKNRIEKLERIVNPPEDTVISVHVVKTDPDGTKRDYFTGEVIEHAPGTKVITVKPKAACDE
jgi:hypothetical protein